MILSVASIFPPSHPLYLRSSAVPPLPALDRILISKRSHRRILQRRRVSCRAGLAQDAPFVAAIGACVLNSLVFPVKPGGPGDEDEESASMDSTDTRLAIMAIISFIPYFNWLGWVFAWMDSGRQRYLVYSIVYLAPYLRTNLSISPEESWLPIASILLCIVHVQLETSIKNGDFDGFQFPIMKEEAKLKSKKSATMGRERRNSKLPSAGESREKLRDWGISLNPRDDMPPLNENLDDHKSD